ncbi:cytochrome b/b6 domain-containing protein [Streptomyces himalayensis]|uniref:Cytochrome b/b6 domain-containing protein n=1 Tax=Streptomyces himalayensis subsp. himalayensis TaxID=2756131 RepID=A0A7W0IBA3_9ACTN|nr:cytochrome b/b6 domain-containing protein [Streptomyces himalayensis]MBA2949202.1 cytochrome b/b6 domain-containing protein [Streptomyces himalayensis subsp. himalayensis]
MNPRRKIRSLPLPSPTARGAVAAMTLLLIPVLVFIGGDGFRDFLNFAAGVLSLVALTSSVIWGLVATDRLFLNSRQRLLAQAVHRATAVAALGFLLLHITVKLALDHTTLLAALIPFGLGFTGTQGLIGFGSLAALLMVTTGLTGALRSAFASPVQVAARWRAVHMLAYPAWCSALVHGLYAGRPAAPWVTVMYCLALAAVMGAIALRAAPLPVKRQVAARILAVLQPDDRGADEARIRRDTADSPLPGTVLPGSSLSDMTTGGPTPRGSGLGGAPFGDSALGGTTTLPRPEPAFPFPSDLRGMTPPSPPLYEAPPRPSPTPRSPGAGAGISAAYRAVSSIPRARDGLERDATERMDLPLDLRPTEALPRFDDTGPTPTPGRWPTPSPPPPGEAPPSTYGSSDAYGPSGTYSPSDTQYGTNLSYGRSHDAYERPSSGAYDPAYDTPHNGTPYAGAADPAYDSGPATEPLPGTFQAPSSGEPWNAPTGGTT